MKANITMIILLLISVCSNAQKVFETDEFKTSKGVLKITFIGHGSLMLEWNKKIIQIDPYSKLADYSNFPKADIILITHDHQDHLDESAIEKISKDVTKIIMNSLSNEKLKNKYNAVEMKNGDQKSLSGLKIEAVPAYNVINKRKDGNPFHPKGEGNGYVLTMGNKRIYIAGDTENIPEMKDLKDIDIAFLPMNLPYTMTPEMVTQAAKSFNPKILYPYHFGSTDPELLKELLKNESGIELRIREMQ
ncbi:MAG: MBL fold metallo-hydrolase [Saprospiraceae bacterium]|nr:MBL fold metallo-hydrolase [Saprospiraceae bacterium]